MDFIKEITKDTKPWPKIKWVAENGLVYIHMTPIIQHWFVMRHKTKRLVLVQLKKHQACVATNYLKRIGGRPYRCVVFRRDHMPKIFWRILHGKSLENRFPGRSQQPAG